METTIETMEAMEKLWIQCKNYGYNYRNDGDNDKIEIKFFSRKNKIFFVRENLDEIYTLHDLSRMVREI